MSIFKKKNNSDSVDYDSNKMLPVIKSSICTGEMVAGFKDIETGVFTDVMLLKGDADLEAFKKRYGITGEISKIY